MLIDFFLSHVVSDHFSYWLCLVHDRRHQGAVWTNHGLLGWLIIIRLLNHGSWSVFSGSAIGHYWPVFNFMFDLLVIGIRNLNGLIIGILDGLVVC